MREFGRIMAYFGATTIAVVLGLIVGGSTRCTALYWLTQDAHQLEFLIDKQHISSMVQVGARPTQTCHPLGFHIEGSAGLAGFLTMFWIILFVTAGLIIVRMMGKRPTPPENS